MRKRNGEHTEIFILAFRLTFHKVLSKTMFFCDRRWGPQTSTKSSPNVNMEFATMMAILRTDSDFDEYYRTTGEYIDVVYIKEIDELKPTNKNIFHMMTR